MLELARTRAAVVGAFAEPPAIDALEGSGVGGDGAFLARPAPDEAMLVAHPGSTEAMLRDATEILTGADPHCLVLDATDGWAVWTLRGNGARSAFSRLSAVHLGGDGFTHGDVLRVPVRMIAEAERVHLFVPAMWGVYLRDGVLNQCASLGISEARTPADWGNGA